MKVFTPEEVERKRKEFEGLALDKVSASVGGIKFDYFVLPASANEELPLFVERAIGKPGEPSAFAISEEVPKILRPYWVAHEVVEFLHLASLPYGRCYNALNWEMGVLRGKLYKNHVSLRERFFSGLVSYASKHPESFTPIDVREMQTSFDTLRQMNRWMK